MAWAALDGGGLGARGPSCQNHATAVNLCHAGIVRAPNQCKSLAAQARSGRLGPHRGAAVWAPAQRAGAFSSCAAAGGPRSRVVALIAPRPPLGASLWPPSLERLSQRAAARPRAPPFGCLPLAVPFQPPQVAGLVHMERHAAQSAEQRGGAPFNRPLSTGRLAGASLRSCATAMPPSLVTWLLARTP